MLCPNDELGNMLESSWDAYVSERQRKQSSKMELLKTNILKSALDKGVMVKALMRTVPDIDRVLMKASRGRLNLGLQTVVLIETIGARSGQVREIVTLCMPVGNCLLYTSPSPRDQRGSRMPSSA